MAEDISPENGKSAPSAASTVEPPLGAVGTGKGYSGQEYDSTDQARWRAEQDAAKAPADGEAKGSGAAAGAPDRPDVEDDS